MLQNAFVRPLCSPAGRPLSLRAFPTEKAKVFQALSFVCSTAVLLSSPTSALAPIPLAPAFPLLYDRLCLSLQILQGCNPQNPPPISLPRQRQKHTVHLFLCAFFFGIAFFCINGCVLRTRQSRCRRCKVVRTYRVRKVH